LTATAELHDLGQSDWLDNITREMLDSGRLQPDIDDYSVTGLTSNPAIFDKAIASGDGHVPARHEDQGRGPGCCYDHGQVGEPLTAADQQTASLVA
jgi:transaldolase